MVRASAFQFIEITANVSHQLHLAAGRTDANPYSESGISEFVTNTKLVSRLVPSSLISVLHQLATRHQCLEALLVKRALCDLYEVPETPLTPSARSLGSAPFIPEAILFTLASLLGGVYAFRFQHRGALIQNLVPVRSDSHSQVGTSSSASLEWHVEDAYTDLRPDFLCLFCLRGADSAITRFTSIEDVVIEPGDEVELRKEQFSFEMDNSYSGMDRRMSATGAILQGRSPQLEIRFDPLYTTVVGNNENARRAQASLARSIEANAKNVILTRGDILFLNNRSTVHSRTPFRAKYDGTDRWIQRAIVRHNQIGVLQARKDLLVSAEGVGAQ